MPRLSAAGVWGWCALALVFAAACAQQSDGLVGGGSAGNATKGGSGGTAGTGASAGTGAGTSSAGKGGSGGSTAGTGGTSVAGSDAGGAESSAGASSAGTAGADTGQCSGAGDCDDDNPCTDDACNNGTCEHTDNTGPCATDDNVCTDDVCSEGACIHENNTASCTADGSDCTNDVCGEGECTHVDNGQCECLTDEDCTGGTACEFKICGDTGSCSYPSNESCGTGAVFTVNNFNSLTDWGGNKTSPDQRALTTSGFNLTNLEGTVVFLAASNPSTLTMDVADMTGLTNLTIDIQSTTTGTASMVKVGAYNGSTWSDLPLADYGTISNTSYDQLSVPIVDFGFPQGDITKIRLTFTPTGGERVWRIDNIATTD